VKSSERLRPNAFTRMRTSPFWGVGIGSVSSLRTSGPPGEWMTTAFMVAMASCKVFCCEDTSDATCVGDLGGVIRDGLYSSSY
jgi:hypothetical protein